MESAKLWELLVAGFLLLTLLTDPAAACVCRRKTPRTAYCRSPIILKAKVQDVTEDETKFERHYKIQITQVLKGPEELKSFRSLQTATESSLCGYKHPTPFDNDEYVFSVRRYGDRLTITLCNLSKKWKNLSHADKIGFQGGYRRSCY